MDNEQMWLTLRNYHFIQNGVKCSLPQWHNDHVIAEAEAELDVQDGCKNAKLCNWDHFMGTRGWIA